jgi:RNA 2',3'-cyclic 3'-phosphodiesterase
MVPLPRRLFIGLLPDRQVQAAIQRHCREWEWPEGARPTRFGRYHVTLHFLGEVGVAPEQRLRTILRKVAIEPLELELRTTELWRNHVAVLRPADHQGLQALRDRVGQAISAAGLPPAGKFTPHVTLARDAAQARPPEATRPIAWRVQEVALIWSLLWPEAKPARYEIVERFGITPGREMLAPAPSGQDGEQLALFG